MADLHDTPIAQANAAIRDLIQSLPGGRITPLVRPEYERLVAVYMNAARGDEDEARPAA